MTIITEILSTCCNFDIIGIFEPRVHVLNWLLSLVVMPVGFLCVLVCSRKYRSCNPVLQTWKIVLSKLPGVPYVAFPLLCIPSSFSNFGDISMCLKQQCSLKRRGWVAGFMGLCPHDRDGHVNKQTQLCLRSRYLELQDLKHWYDLTVFPVHH